MSRLLLPALGHHETNPKADVLPDCLQIPGVDNGYCKWGLVIGEDWSVLNGLGEGVTQLARRGRGVQAFPTGIQKCVRERNIPFGLDWRFAGTNPEMVWNFPIDLTFQSSNAFGWPKLHFSVYGIDFLGADVVQGYGFTHIPCCAGR